MRWCFVDGFIMVPLFSLDLKANGIIEWELRKWMNGAMHIVAMIVSMLL